jgi:hypothetical protein
LQFLVFRDQLDYKALKEIRVIRVMLVHRDQKVIRANLDHRENVESLEKAEKAMIHLQDNIQVGHTIKMDQINLLF